ncbi:MAG: two-component system response regulator CreB [Pseudomonadota bacterium]
MNRAILIVEDEKEIADALIYALASEKFTPIWASNCQIAQQLLSEQQYALAIFDVGLPDGNGFDLLRKLRQEQTDNQDIPVIFLTARSEEIDRIVGLEIGADDYVCKPFSPRELVARVNVILRRLTKATEANSDSTTTTVNSPFSHIVEQRQILLQESVLDLTRAEYQLLLMLLSQPSRVFSRRQLIESIWSSNHPSDDRAIDTHIKTLRAKLRAQNPHADFIVTHRGFGYSLEL